MKLTFSSPGDLAWIAKFRILSSIPRFIPNSAFYPQFRVLSPIPRFIPNSAFYPQFRVLSPIPRFIPNSLLFILNSAFYPQFRALSPIPRFILDSGSPFRLRIPVLHSGSAFRFRVLSLPVYDQLFHTNIDGWIDYKRTQSNREPLAQPLNLIVVNWCLHYFTGVYARTTIL